MTVQPNALAAITAALTQRTNGAPAPAPVQQGFTFTPAAPAQVQPFVQQSAPAPSNPFAPPSAGALGATAPQPSPVQAHAAFVAAVPQAAQQHAHPVTGVAFAPINPPGEAASAPTAGLGASPPTGPLLASLPIPDPAPKAPRARKPRSTSVIPNEVADAMIAGMQNTIAETFASVAGSGAALPAAASVAPSASPIVGAPRNATPTLQELADFDQALFNTSTEVLRDELVRRGYIVRLSNA